MNARRIAMACLFVAGVCIGKSYWLGAAGCAFAAAAWYLTYWRSRDV